MRTLESTDLGMIWKVVDWAGIDKAWLPAEAEMPLKGAEYYYDVDSAKVLTLPQSAKLSLGIKHRYLDFFSKKITDL